MTSGQRVCSDQVYSVLGGSLTESPDRLIGAFASSTPERNAAGDFVKNDLIAAAVDLLLAAQRASVLASPEALAEPAARVRRVQAVLSELSEHLG
ncbi:hypothetical protein [Pseudonocardia sp. NPDC049635]|uniref:hypothetical protein n=1 Tax=Pseudonocardia sp. NPDC049635 TaxID=3155506 RepID=UPI0033ED280C